MSFAPRIRDLLHRQKILAGGLLLMILALGGFLRFYRLGEAGIGNTYYAAAVKSMLLSWKNFFFVAFEPGGSLSLDKPPLGFWVEALSAYFLGVTGFALALPNVCAGVLSIFITYKLVRRSCGAWFGLLAALVLAVTPVAISTERNNTIDGMLVFVLLLAAWAFLQSVDTGKLRWLLLGAFIVGLGFNTKMMQAFLPLPAFYALYFFGAKHSPKKKILHLCAATAVLLVVSLSWAIAVDLTLASERPYVDSSSNNTVMELITGHNGLVRLIKSDGKTVEEPESGGVVFWITGSQRLFTAPLAGEASWLLPFVLGGLLLLAVRLWKQPFGDQHLALILWAGWLLPELLYFSYNTGLMHAHYLIMLGAPLAALTAMTAWAFGEVIRERPWFGWGLLSVLVVMTLVFQGATLWRESARAIWALVFAGFLLGSGLLLIALDRLRPRTIPIALALVLTSMLSAPATWSALTTLNPAPETVMPYAGPNRQPMALVSAETDQNSDSIIDSPSLLNYLLANTKPETYLLATDRVNRAAAYILKTGRPVLTLGGFTGKYAVVTVNKLTSLIKNGQLRFALVDEPGQPLASIEWIQQNCILVEPASFAGTTTLPGEPANNASLYDCKK